MKTIKELYKFYNVEEGKTYKITNIQKETIMLYDLKEAKIISCEKGDTFTIKAVKELPNSSYNAPVDSQGAEIRDMYILKNNVPENFWGDVQFSYYLGVQDSFIASNFAAEGGEVSESELRNGNYLEPVEFSDFSVDPITGDIAGEIRLAYWHEGDKVTPVRGGSVSGTLAELIKNVRLSRELSQYDNTLVPSAIRIEGVTVTGA